MNSRMYAGVSAMPPSFQHYSSNLAAAAYHGYSTSFASSSYSPYESSPLPGHHHWAASLNHQGSGQPHYLSPCAMPSAGASALSLSSPTAGATSGHGQGADHSKMIMPGAGGQPSVGQTFPGMTSALAGNLVKFCSGPPI